MGVIRVKLANNYIPLPIPAAADYFQLNKTIKLIAPDNIVAGTWEIAKLVDLRKGFGAYARKTDGTYWGFNVCFLFNQSTGFTELYLKHLNQQNANGVLTDNYLKWWEAGNLEEISGWRADANRGLASDSGTFIHPAWLAINRLNEISTQDGMDIDFTYPSPIHQDQPNYYLNDTNVNVPLTKRTQQTSQRTELTVPGTTQEENEGFGAYGDNPWPKCSMMSFYSVTAQSGENPTNIEENMSESINECFADQQSAWEEQWDVIDGEGGGPS